MQGKSMRRFLYRLLFIALLLISQITLPVSFAIFLPNLFQADIPIEHNTQSERDLALGTALFGIITKITPSPLNSEQKKQLQQSPWRFVSSYTVKKATPLNTNTPTHAIEPLIFHVQINQQQLKAWLKEQNIAFWSNYRPLTLVWLSIDNDMQKLIVGDTDQLITQILNKTAKQYGIPLQFPKADVRDLEQVSANDIWNFNTTALKKASKRYRPDIILAGRIFPTTTGWEASWHLITNHHHQALTWRSASEHLSGVLKTATAKLAQTLAKLYQNSQEEHQLTLQVHGIDHLQQYRNLTTYLSQQHMISQVQTRSIAADRVTLSIISNVNPQQLLKTLALSRKLITIEDQASPASWLNFRWQG
ncbi:hypothetical protein AVI51_06750 [Piscirickettsia salmonis]|nr:hypothetical protein AVI48_01950 [Piscirickettsia salmonis]ERL61967.1 hypothetical protein K661_01688 [Piscirickettsia salmonis LF-89 = ATCC VR-1361]WGZ71830.1 DUF2066 domain-containing protein [Piscirickettsia salmonis EM-90]APS46607.1 hypothetical protein AVI49_02550 [Piscirickettsia salmonis]APS50584.1 hypothetical protein AVI50_06825 [Piscirickettsia salmonis]